MSEIGTRVKHPKNGEGVVTKVSADSRNERYKNLVRYVSGAMEWMSDKDVREIEWGAENETAVPEVEVE